ncbi:MAG: S8 family serine peptidase, partial [Cyclobacteriaceae bacterium]|nr:S8 family serine peptidase [Cyclobacteriaceae bacterium]
MKFNLQKLQTERRVVDSIQSNKAKEYSLQFDIPLLTRTDHYTKQLVGIDDAGIPLFISTDNAKAAITTGVTGVRIGGSLGLNLEGKGMTIGIWDGGKVGHLEYNERIISTEGSNSDAHATHVSGTMVATGINSVAKGMAPKAQLISYDFNNDLSEMAALAKPDQTSLIISNHSYGFVTGWDCTVTPCQWRGNATISNKEDYRFGFYSSNTRNWDVLANNAPYYSIIKSAGNDRSNGSGAIYPPDCNGGSGYDCIEEQATAKNIMTIGAVNAVLNYTDPSSVVMSSFSGWGPTDDGRIKPDLVADGVNVFSTVLNNSYGNLSGTSMSTPNVTGSLALVQELYKKLNGGNYMLASTLKAVAIHTAKEAGTNPGPDFSFGWGLLDVEAASRMLLSKFNKGVVIKEIVLKNGDTYELPIQSKENYKITATIVWNDPASTATPASLDPTAIKLVNDLDLRITDELGNKEYPWILSTELENLSLPASKGDNIRDNVEKIELLEPTKQVYTLSIKHKGSLTGGSQVVSLVVTYTPVESLPSSLYWVGGSGDWSDPAHWSISSGGSSGNTIPSSADHVIFDENSFSANGTVNVTENVNCNSLLLLASTEKIEFTLNNKQIGLAGDLVAADTTFRIVDNGTLKFQSATADSKTITLNNCDFASVNLDFFAGSYVLRGKAKINAVNLNSGSLDMANSVLGVQTLSSFG